MRDILEQGMVNLY